jgi:hypothetical protein
MDFFNANFLEQHFVYGDVKFLLASIKLFIYIVQRSAFNNSSVTPKAAILTHASITILQP